MSKKDRAPRTTRNERREARPGGPSSAPRAASGARASTDSSGARPMSEVLDEFIAPLLAGVGTSRANVERAYALGTAVWNATAPSSSPAELKATIELFARKTGDAEGARQVVSMLVQRRVDRFFGDARTIVDVELDWSGPTPRAKVSSIVVPQ